MEEDNNSDSRKSTPERVDKVFLSSVVLEYFLSCGNGEGIMRESIRFFYKKNEVRLMKKISRNSLDRCWRKSGLSKLYDSLEEMESVVDYKDDAIELLSLYLNFMKSSVQSPFEEMSNLSTAEKEKLKKLHESNKILTADEEEHILNVCTKLGNFGFPVTLKIVAKIINRTIEKRMNDASVHAIHFCSKSYVKAFVRRNTELGRLVRAACLDPVRADNSQLK